MFNYYGKRWKRKRKHILKLDGYIDRIEKRYGRTVEAVVVHHIYPADEYPEYAWCDWNLISVSLATHNKLENRKTGELTKLGLELRRRTVPGVDWRHTTDKIYRKNKSKNIFDDLGMEIENEQSRDNICKEDM